MKRPFRKAGRLPTRLVFLLVFALFYWGFNFIYAKTSLQLSQVVFDLAAGIFAGAVLHVAVAKAIGPLLFGRAFCGWACWNAAVFDIVPVGDKQTRLPARCLMVKYLVLAVVLVVPVILLLKGYGFTGRSAQFRWLLVENGVIYFLGIGMALVLGDRRAFCKYLCPAGALMTAVSPRSVLKIEKNHLRCNKCGKCEEVCPMGVPVVSYIAANQRVSHPECILCTECVSHCPNNCLTVGIGRKSNTRPEFGRSY